MESKEVPAAQSLTISRRFGLDFWKILLLSPMRGWGRASHVGELPVQSATGQFERSPGRASSSTSEKKSFMEFPGPQTPPSFPSSFQCPWQSRLRRSSIVGFNLSIDVAQSTTCHAAAAKHHMPPGSRTYQIKTTTLLPSSSPCQDSTCSSSQSRIPRISPSCRLDTDGRYVRITVSRNLYPAYHAEEDKVSCRLACSTHRYATKPLSRIA